ncbi:uncharacterized protein LOC143270769 [Peromyscus maniculatus bairdii]|uniref:uncharacterized protein LOC143270769 n=1 Tax=Peromyscus maniculatus bairdii TaxID=230844 RepID=UPI003FD36DFD
MAQKFPPHFSACKKSRRRGAVLGREGKAEGNRQQQQQRPGAERASERPAVGRETEKPAMPHPPPPQLCARPLAQQPASGGTAPGRAERASAEPRRPSPQPLAVLRGAGASEARRTPSSRHFLQPTPRCVSGLRQGLKLVFEETREHFQ